MKNGFKLKKSKKVDNTYAYCVGFSGTVRNGYSLSTFCSLSFMCIFFPCCFIILTVLLAKPHLFNL